MKYSSELHMPLILGVQIDLCTLNAQIKIQNQKNYLLATFGINSAFFAFWNFTSALCKVCDSPQTIWTNKMVPASLSLSFSSLLCVRESVSELNNFFIECCILSDIKPDARMSELQK